jgi:2'-hydroxyisoflavone reductase
VNVLVLGGTVFFGRHLVRALLARGHTVTIFNRGNHDVDGDLPVIRIHGDRTNTAGLARLTADGWDAVVDPSSDIPDVVEASARHLRNARRYVYISSISVYHLDKPIIDETSPLFEAVEGDPLAMTAEAYGWRKATSEKRVGAVFGERATLIRPGLIVGPYDPSDRFTYWPMRFARGGNVVVPAPPERGVQFVDVRDVADFVIRSIENSLVGAYNVTSPRGAVTMRDVVDACREGIDVLPAATWIDGDFLTAHGCEGWVDIPLWIPPDSPYPGILNADVSRAVHAGLIYRPLRETIRDIRDWYAASGRTELKAGLGPQKESELLDAWNAAISS